MRISKIVLAALLPVWLAACSITPKVAESADKSVRLECTTSTPVVDGTAVTACVADFSALGADGKSDHSKRTRQGHMFSATPTLANVAVGSTSGALAARLQGNALVDAAEIGKCSEGANCGTQILNLNHNNANGGVGVGVGGSAGAASNSYSNSGAAATIKNSTAGKPCLDCYK